VVRGSLRASSILLINSSGSRESALNICDVYLSSSTAIEVASEPCLDLQMGGGYEPLQRSRANSVTRLTNLPLECDICNSEAPLLLFF
jgi:hypothetical protein